MVSVRTFKVFFIYKSLCKTRTPLCVCGVAGAAVGGGGGGGGGGREWAWGHLWLQGYYLNNLGTGLQDKVTYQILKALVF